MVHVLGSRILLRPTDPERSRAFYGERLGLDVHREFGTGPERGTVYFLGGGFLELSGRADGPRVGSPEVGAPEVGAPEAGAPEARVRLWMQVADVAAAHDELRGKGVPVVRPPVREPWGLVEMWIEDPDGTPIVLVEVPADHPLRYRPGI